jgi:hypothetical protein
VTNDTGADFAHGSVIVMLPPNEFSNQNLERIFEILIDKYPKSEWLNIYVYTNLEDKLAMGPRTRG